MAAIDDLVGQIADEKLRARIQDELKKLSSQKKFGLVFEEHLPECTPLYDVPVKRGSQVALKAGKIDNVYKVIDIVDGKALCLPKTAIAGKDETTKEELSFALDDLVCVAEFGEPIYPYLKQIDTVRNAPDSSLWHTVIEAENYHALQLLEYLYAGKVDCIYIDPPYNTGARDWKYNNEYVDSSDAYRHSKWLSFMEKRLRLAKKLLSESGCIFISIDDVEACNLKILCDDVFGINSFVAQIPWRKRTAKSDVPFGISQDCESILCYANPNFKAAVKGKERKYYETPDFPNRPWRFHDLTKQTTIKERPNSNFTIINPKTGKKYPVNPLRSWAVTKDTFEEYYRQDRIIFPGDYEFLKISKPVFRYWKEDDIKKAGADFGLVAVSTIFPDYVGMTQDGTKELTTIFNDKRFNFPKPLQLIKYLINISTANKPNALIVDFFAGSGTTLHAVNLLNAEDGGNRRCILVTNNEVSEAEAKTLTSQGFKPGDAEWEKLGIAHYVTWPRTVCSIEGHDINGEPLKGNYLGSDIPMSDGFKANAAFFKLGFLDKISVALGRQFKELLPLLWLKAGAIGECPSMTVDEMIPKMLIFPENKFAILVEETAFQKFKAAIDEANSIQTVFIITDYDGNYRAMSNALHVKMTYQLYRDYLDNFRINHRRN